MLSLLSADTEGSSVMQTNLVSARHADVRTLPRYAVAAGFLSIIRGNFAAVYDDWLTASEVINVPSFTAAEITAS